MSRDVLTLQKTHHTLQNGEILDACLDICAVEVMCVSRYCVDACVTVVDVMRVSR